ncbi:hypothetical protein [Lacticaseibacillus paracasei]|uniref:hypothetical protein n=1 Tax=Lacticaseibacillus paracasei TaxID=1597 RepID=UPI000FFB14AE|nr:hypothetical protein [Lacticaseibacillus paracasei]
MDGKRGSECLLKSVSNIDFNPSLLKTQSHNVLQLVEEPLDDNHELRGNLRAILVNDVPYVQEVRMSLAAFQELGSTDAPMRKVRIG